MSRHSGNANLKAMTKKDQIVNTLTEQIEGGEIGLGERLAGEKALASQFQVSRGTVREALGELQRRRLIATRSGVGSVVIYDGHTLDHSQGWTAALSDAGRCVTTEVLAIGVVDRREVPDLPDEVSGADFVLVARRRKAAAADGAVQAVSLEHSYVPNIGFLASLPRRGLYQNSLMASLGQAGLADAQGEQRISLCFLEPDAAALLDRPVGTPFLRTVRTSFNASGRFVEHVVSHLDPAHFTISSKFGATS
ncbi:MAG: GntR family transcriptional regulator [Bifidobacteriaceae bacterium]|jgi:GntR family transcriptional regulator|nr:GntR family transcriptional regulator [Bifidobacteriaceae bacterium]